MQKSASRKVSSISLSMFFALLGSCIFSAWGGFYLGINMRRSCEQSDSIINSAALTQQIESKGSPNENSVTDNVEESKNENSVTDNLEESKNENSVTENLEESKNENSVTDNLVEKRKIMESNVKGLELEQDQGLSMTRHIHSLCHKQLTTRGEIPAYLTALDLMGEGVEIGVRDGDFSQWVLSHWNGIKLHLVDPWVHQDVNLYNDKSNVGQSEQDQLHLNVVNMMTRRFPGRFQIHRDYSVNAAKSFQDNSLDYIYIDGRHDYKGVKEDLQAWYPKLKNGGLFAGHDFVPDGLLSTGDFGVQKSVSEFAQLNGKEVLSISTKNVNGGREEPQSVDGGWTTWYFLK